MKMSNVPYIHLENVFAQLEMFVKEGIEKNRSPGDIVEAMLEHLLDMTPEMVDAAYRQEGSPLGAYRNVIIEVIEQRFKTSWHPV